MSPLGFGHYSSHSSPGSSMRPAKVSMRKGAGMTLLHRSVSQSGLPPIQHSAMLQHHRPIVRSGPEVVAIAKAICLYFMMKK